MAKPLLPDELWERIEPLLPPLPPHPNGGRPWVGNREALTGILFRFADGYPLGISAAGNGLRLRYDLLASTARLASRPCVAASARTSAGRVERAHKIDWSRAIVDSAMLRAMCGGPKTGPNPTDRRKPGSKHHVLTDAWGVPLVLILTAANVHDVKKLLPLVDQIPPVRGKPGPPRRHPERVQADTAYDSEPHRQALRKRGITPVIPKRQREHGSGLGVYRWVVERTLSWLHNFRRLRIRWEYRDDIHESFMKLAEALVCFNILTAGLC